MLALAHTGNYHPLLGRERKNALAVEPNHIARFQRYRCPLPLIFFFCDPKKATLAFQPIYRKTKTKSERENITTKLSVMVDIIFTYSCTELEHSGAPHCFQLLKFHLILWHDKQPFPSFLGAIDLSILRPICL